MQVTVSAILKQSLKISIGWINYKITYFGLPAFHLIYTYVGETLYSRDMEVEQ